MATEHETGRLARKAELAAKGRGRSVALAAAKAVRDGRRLAEVARKTLAGAEPLEVLAAIGVATGMLAADVEEGDAAISKAHELAVDSYSGIRADRMALHEAQAKGLPLPAPVYAGFV